MTLWGFELISNYTLPSQSEGLNKLRFTPLATTVHLLHPPGTTLNRNLSSNRFPKCGRNKGCFIFLQEIGRRIMRSNFRVLKKLYQALFICKKLAADDDAYLGWGWSKIWLFCIKSWFFCISKHFSQNIMMPCYWYYFCIFSIFNFFLFEFTNFSFKPKYNHIAVYSVNCNYLFLKEKQEKKCWNLIKSDWISDDIKQ